ncbi:hypothetical protein TNCV_1500791 [Trichonephila clavipes]|nr:hypothetical protein TNCV_1500791 [Trichonephila clavipes]
MRTPGGPRDIESFDTRSKGAQHCSDVATSWLRIFGPFRANGHHGTCTTVPSSALPEESLSNSVQDFHDTMTSPVRAAMQFFEYLWDTRSRVPVPQIITFHPLIQFSVLRHIHELARWEPNTCLSCRTISRDVLPTWFIAGRFNKLL